MVCSIERAPCRVAWHGLGFASLLSLLVLTIAIFSAAPAEADERDRLSMEQSSEVAHAELPTCMELPCSIFIDGQSYQLSAEPHRYSTAKVGFIAQVETGGIPYATLSVTFEYANQLLLMLDATRTFHSKSAPKESTRVPIPNKIGFAPGRSTTPGFIPDLTTSDIVVVTYLLIFSSNGGGNNVTAVPACVDRVFPPMGCEFPVTGLPFLPIATEEGEKCCRKHDHCFRTSHTQLERLGCDAALMACAATSLGGLGAPYGLGVGLGTAIAGGLVFTPENSECWCDWELPDEIDELIASTVQEGMTVQASQCCSAEGECMAGAQCGVVVTGRRPGTTISRKIRWVGTCKKGS